MKRSDDNDEDSMPAYFEPAAPHAQGEQPTVDEIAEATADARLWTGAWKAMGSGERDVMRQGAEGVHKLLVNRRAAATAERTDADAIEPGLAEAYAGTVAGQPRQLIAYQAELDAARQRGVEAERVTTYQHAIKICEAFELSGGDINDVKNELREQVARAEAIRSQPLPKGKP